MKNKFQPSTPELRKRILEENKRIEELCKKHGIPFKDTTAEHEGKVAIFIRVKTDDDDTPAA